MAGVVMLRLVTLWSVLALGTSEMIISGCSNAFIRLQCNHDETLTVSQISLEEDRKGLCRNIIPNMNSNDDYYPPVPASMRHICPYASDCMYEKNICNDKNDCVFYVSGKFRGEDGKVKDNAVVTIDYSCAAGTARIGGVVGFLIVAAALGITMITVAFMLLRKTRTLEDESKYVEFENRLSRSGSMTSEISAKKEAAARIKDIEASGGAEALPAKSTQF